MTTHLRLKILLVCACLAALLFTRTVRADDSDTRVNVVVDLTAEGKMRPRPTSDHPAYYIPIAAGNSDLGEPLPPSVFQDKPPPSNAEVEQMLVPALADQGYRLASRQTPPTIILVCAWGYINPHLGPRGMIVNEEEVVPMIAGDNTEVQIMHNMPPWMDELIRSERQPRYYLMVTAMDYQAYRRHHMVKLWTARISVPLWGHYLFELMPTMIAAGVPAFGQQTGRPQQFTADIIPAGHAVLGQLHVRADPSPPPPPARTP